VLLGFGLISLCYKGSEYSSGRVVAHCSALSCLLLAYFGESVLMGATRWKLVRYRCVYVDPHACLHCAAAGSYEDFR